jgi:hypothetical protein
MEQKGVVVPIGKLLNAIAKEDQQDALRGEDEFSSYGLSEDEEELIERLGKCIKVQDLQDTYASFTGDTEELPASQAIELLELSILWFYDKNNENVDMDEVLQYTHKVEARTRKINTLLAQLDTDNPFPNELEGMKDLLKEFQGATREMERQRSAHQTQVEELRTLKRGLLLQLQAHQSSSENVNSAEDPTSVNSLLSHGIPSRYHWRMSMMSENPLRDNDPKSREIDIDEYDATSFGNAQGPSGHSQQPRYLDEESDDELREDY